MSTEHINITIPSDLRKKLDKQAKKYGTKRSTLIQRAVRTYLTLISQKDLRSSLEEGYAALGEESKRLEQEFSKIDAESLKYAD